MLLGRGDGGASSEASDGCCCIRTGVPQTSAGTPQLKQLLEDTWDQKGNPVYRPFGAGSIHNEGAGKMGPAGSALLVLSTRFHALKLLPPACHHVPLLKRLLRPLSRTDAEELGLHPEEFAQVPSRRRWKVGCSSLLCHQQAEWPQLGLHLAFVASVSKALGCSLMLN
nr:uncharacterized protein LOC110364592 isoform X2 [Columba livia]